MNLTTQDEQIACFQNVAAHLAPGGRFVIEVGVPQLQRLPPGETIRAFDVSSARLGFDEYDVASQGLISHHYREIDGTLQHLAVPFRYVWPTELDLMARLAGMTLRKRWAGWKHEPFTSDSQMPSRCGRSKRATGTVVGSPAATTSRRSGTVTLAMDSGRLGMRPLQD